MNLFRKRAQPTNNPRAASALPKAAVCFPTPAMTRRAADWLGDLGGCQPIGILSDDCGDVVWQCDAEQADLLLLATDFSDGAEDPKDISSRCDIAIEVRRRLPECRVYLVCEDSHPEKLPALEQAAELNLIDGYCIGELTAQQARVWLREAAETMNLAGKPAAATIFGKEGNQTCDNGNENG